MFDEKELHVQSGGNPDHALPIVLIDGGYSYVVRIPSGKTIPVFRCHKDAKNYLEISRALRGLL